MEIETELRKLPVEGYIWLNVRATNTEPNTKVHKAFKSFAKIETDDNYTQALRKLLEYYDLYQNDSQYEELHAKIEALIERVEVLESKVVKINQPHEDKEDGCF